MSDEKIITLKCPVLNSEKDSTTSEILLRLDKSLKPVQIMCPFFDNRNCELSEKECVYLDWKKI